MSAIKSVAEIARKYVRVTPGRTEDYALGVRSPRVDWQSATSAAEGAWEAGLQAAISAKRFGAGVQEAGTAKWQRKAAGVGKDRWAPGIREGAQDFEKGFAPYAQVIEGLELPPRGPKGDPNNIERVRLMAEALHARKVAA